MRNTAAHSITKNHLCFVCHGEPDKCQEDFNCGCGCSDNTFLCENKCASHQSKICLNTYLKALLAWLYILSRCVEPSQQPWRGTCNPATDSRYTLIIITDMTFWKIQSGGGLSIIFSLTPTRTSANVNYQSSLLIGNKILQNIPAVMKYKISVTRIQKSQYNDSIGPCC